MSRWVKPIVLEDGAFILKMGDEKTGKVLGQGCIEIPDAFIAEKMFENLWKHHEKNTPLV